jgi:hypothetical protein
MNQWGKMSRWDVQYTLRQKLPFYLPRNEMKRRKILAMLTVELEKLSTKQLLARLKQLHQCEQTLSFSDREGGDKHSGAIGFKDSSEWVSAYHQVKDILANREHVPKGAELIKIRKEKAH